MIVMLGKKSCVSSRMFGLSEVRDHAKSPDCVMVMSSVVVVVVVLVVVVDLVVVVVVVVQAPVSL